MFRMCSRVRRRIALDLRRIVTPRICEDVVELAVALGWTTKQVHEAFLINAALPTALDHMSAVLRLFATQQSLGFPAQHLIQIPSARILGISGFVLLDDDRFVVEGNCRAWHVVHSPGAYIPSVAPTKREGDWYLIRSFWPTSYYHWFWDELPRLQTALPYLPADIHFLVADPLQEFQRVSLAALGVCSERIHILRPSDYFRIQHLWFATPLGHSSHSATSPRIARLLSELLTTALVPTPQSPHGRFFISRRNSRVRRLLNEDEIYGIARGKGFELVLAEELGFEDQVKLFSSAEAIVGPHGAGLTNMIFAPAGCRVLELFEPMTPRHCYWMMAHCLGHNYSFVEGSTPADQLQSSVDRDFVVQPHDFEQCLNRLTSSLSQALNAYAHVAQ